MLKRIGIALALLSSCTSSDPASESANAGPGEGAASTCPGGVTPCPSGGESSTTADGGADGGTSADPHAGHDAGGDASPPPGSAIPSPTINGATPIASNFDVNTALTTTGIPPSNDPDVVGAFRFICGAGQLKYDDPIVYPAQPGKAHLHQFYGNTLADGNSTFASLRATGDSTCNFTGTGTAANRSAYWMPALLDGKGNVVQPDYVQVYYKHIPKTDPKCQPATNPKATGTCIGIPNGLRFIFGYDMATGTNPKPGDFVCTGNGATPTAVDTIPEAKPYCPVGSHFEARIQTPTCWDGTNLDTPDHRSHLKSQIWNGSVGYYHCPTTHPYVLPQFTLGVFYTVGAGDDLSLWHFSSDDMKPNLPHGATFHADYFEAWDASVKQMWQDNCIDKKLNCSGGDLGNGKRLVGASQPSYGWTNPNRLVPVP